MARAEAPPEWGAGPPAPEVQRGPARLSADVARLVITDSPDEAVASVTEIARRRFGLTYGPRAKPRWYLGER